MIPNVVDLAAVRAARLATEETLPPPNRKERWRQARLTLDYLERLRSLAMTARTVARFGVKEAEAYALDDFALLDRARAARANLLLTPAPTKADLLWKRRLIEQPEMKYLTLDAGALASVLAADKEYLRENDRRRKRA